MTQFKMRGLIQRRTTNTSSEWQILSRSTFIIFPGTRLISKLYYSVLCFNMPQLKKATFRSM